MVTRDAKVGGTWLLIRAFARFLIDQIGSAVSEGESTKSNLSIPRSVLRWKALEDMEDIQRPRSEANIGGQGK